MSVLMPGPCRGCGARNYPLSSTGPDLCQRCSDAAGAEQRKSDLKQWETWGLGPAAGTVVNGKLIARSGLEMPYGDARDEGRGHFGVLGEITGSKGDHNETLEQRGR